MHEIKHTSMACGLFSEKGSRRLRIATPYSCKAKLSCSILFERNIIPLLFSKVSWRAPKATIAWRMAGSWWVASGICFSQNSSPEMPSWGAVLWRKKWKQRTSFSLPGTWTDGDLVREVELDWERDDGVSSGTYPSHFLPVEVHRWHAGLSSSHLIRLTGVIRKRGIMKFAHPGISHSCNSSINSI